MLKPRKCTKKLKTVKNGAFLAIYKKILYGVTPPQVFEIEGGRPPHFAEPDIKHCCSRRIFRYFIPIVEYVDNQRSFVGVECVFVRSREYDLAVQFRGYIYVSSSRRQSSGSHLNAFFLDFGSVFLEPKVPEQAVEGQDKEHRKKKKNNEV